MSSKKQILILGGGFGGLYCAMELEKAIDHGLDAEVTIINNENFFLFTPMLHEIAAADLDVTNIVSPVRHLLRKVKFFDGDIDSIDLDAKKVVASHGIRHHAHELDFDQLVVALGSTTNFYNLPGLQERALIMKSLDDALILRNRLISNLEEADFECCPWTRENSMNFVVAGGGFAGVETVGSINDFLRGSLRSYPHLTEAELHVILVHSGSTLLPELGGGLGKYAEQKLKERGVDVRLNTRVAGMSIDGITLSDGTLINSNTLVWTAGTAPHPLLATLTCKKLQGRIAVNEQLEVPDYLGVWALGDCAMVPDPKTGKFHPPTAQHAWREAKVVAHNIRAEIEGGTKKPFSFSTMGMLAVIGKRSGVANLMGVNISGFLAWFLWRTIYLMKLPRLEKKVRVALDWTLDLIFPKDLVKFMTQRQPILSSSPEDGACLPCQVPTAAPAPGEEAPV